MSRLKGDIKQLFRSVIETGEIEVSGSELFRRLKADRSKELRQYLPMLADHGLRALLRNFCQEFAASGADDDGDRIDEPYLNNFPDLKRWEITAAQKFGHKSAYLPEINSHVEVCRMTPQQRVDAGKYGVKCGQDTIDRFDGLKEWGIRGGGTE